MKDDKRLKRKVRNSYIVSTVSITLVLFLLGSVGYLMVAALKVADTLQESIAVTVELKNGLSEEARLERLLPFHRGTFASAAAEHTGQPIFEFTPSVGVVLDSIIPSYVSGYIYSALVDSFCSEQNARMTAMSSAGENADKMLASLSVQYNRVRQAAITQEITEVSAGAKAQRQKHRKEA